MIILDQDYSSQAIIPENMVLGNHLLYYTNATLTYNDAADAIEYKTVGNQSGAVYVGIEPFINGNLSISLRVSSDSWLSNVYIIGSTFMIQTQTLADGRARVTSLYQTSPTARTYQYYDVPVASLQNGVNTINIMISGTTKSLRIYHDNNLGMTTPMYHWSVQKLPYDPMTLPTLMLYNEKSSRATWVSTLLYGIKETVNGGIVTAIPGNDFVPFGIDFPTDFANGLGSQYMATMNQKGVAWIDLGWLEKHPEQIQHTQSLLDSGWELGIHFSTSLTSFSMDQAKSFMVEQYNQATEIFGRSPTTWCSLQNGDNVSHAVFAYEEFGMIWRNGYSFNGYIPNIGNLEETRWAEFWSKISEAQMIYPSFTHETDQATARPFCITYTNFTKWVDNYFGKHIIGFEEYYYRVRNQVDTNINYLDYVEGKTLKFSVQCNQYQSRLVINLPMSENTVVLKNGIPLVRNVDYSVIDSNHIALFAESNDLFEITSPSVPDAPENLQAVAGDAEITLTWTAPANDGGSSIGNYVIYRGTVSGGEQLLTTIGNVLTYTDSSVTNGQTYFYKVSAINIVGEGPQSSEVFATPTLSSTVPSAPQNLIATEGSAQVTLSWSAPSNDGGSDIDYYAVYRDGADLAQTSETSYTDMGLINGQIYSYTVAAHNANGLGLQSTPVQATPRTVPAAPTSLTAVPGNGQVALNWLAPADSGGETIDYYVLYQDELELPTHPTGTSAIVTGLTNGKSYSFKVAAHTLAGSGPQSDAVSSIPYTVPDAPTGLVATLGDAQVSLSWIAPVYDGARAIDYYVVYQDGIELPDHFLGLSTTIAGLTNGQTYSFKVAAHNLGGLGAQSGEALATPANIPGAPTGLTAEAIGASVTLNWAAPSSDGGAAIDYYLVKTDGVLGVTQYFGLTATISNLPVGLHSFLVVAHNSIGIGSESNEATVTVRLDPPGAPTNLVATPGNAQVSLNWTAPTDTGGLPIDYYAIYQDGVELAAHATGASIIVTGLTNGQTYSYYVLAHNAAGLGSQSEQVTATPYSTNIMVTSPAADVVWYKNTTYTIGWTANVLGNVRIELVQGATVVSTIAISTTNDGVQTWRVPYTLAVGSGYQIKISSVNNPNDFTVGPAKIQISNAVVTVTNPNSSSTMVAGGKLTVSWTSAGTIPGLRVQLLKGGSLVATLTQTTANDGNQAFTLPYNLVPGSDYVIRMTDTSNLAVMDDSDSFTIRAPALAVIYPKGGETLLEGASVNIQWSGDMDLLGKVSITLWRNGQLVSTLSSGTANDGSFSWTPSLTLPLGTDYKIRITPLNHPEFYDESDTSFSIRKPILTVSSPVTGASYTRSTTMAINWGKETASIGQIRIELYQNGVLARTIISGTTNDGSYSWRIPSTQPVGDYQIKISSTTDPTIFAWSGSFHIA